MKSPCSLSLVLVFLFTLGLAGRGAAQEARVALIIGCDYAGTGRQLPSPVKDAEALVAKLREVGFSAKDITVLKNPGRKQMLDAIDAFGEALASRKGSGFFYFSGHGCQHEGENYLIPVGAALTYREDLPTETVAASRVVTRMEAAANPVNLLFLDACRTNELPSGKQKSALNKGLASMGGSGLLIGFAAAANRPAIDSGEGSFYTNALIRHMTTPGLSVLQMLTRVRQDVKKATSNEQEPFLYAGLDNDFFFVPESQAAALTAALPATVKPSPSLIPAATPRPSASATSSAPAALPGTAGVNPAIGTMNLKQIFAEHPRTKKAEGQINALRGVAQKELADRIAADQKLTGAALTKAQERTKAWQVGKEKELAEFSVKLRAEIVDEMNRAIMAAPSLSATTLLFDGSALTYNGVLLTIYASPRLDRSGAVLRQLGVETAGLPAEAKGETGLNIATIDMKRVFEGYYLTKEAEEKLNAARAAAKKELDERNAELARVTAQRSAQSAEVQALQKEIAEFRTLRERQLLEQSQRQRAAIIADITRVTTEAAEGEGRVDLLFDASAKTLIVTPFLLHLDGVPDWTESVITTLNSARPGAAKIPIGRANGSVSTAGLRFAVVDMKRVTSTASVVGASEKEILERRERAKAEIAKGADKAAKDKEVADFEEGKRLEMVQRINKFLFDRASKTGFHVVLDSTGTTLNGVPVVTLRQSVPDLTEEVIAALGGGKK